MLFTIISLFLKILSAFRETIFLSIPFAAKKIGIKAAVVFDIDDGRLELAKRIGADEIINTSTPDFMEKTMCITHRNSFDSVLESAGNVHTMHMVFELAANKAHVCFIGTPHRNFVFTQKEWELTAHYFATGQLKFDPDFIYYHGIHSKPSYDQTQQR